jgi:PIN domain nuclease of toxin-antitoxin system
VKLLLDKQVVLWWTHDSRRLRETVRELVGNRRHDVPLSAVLVSAPRALRDYDVSVSS